MLLISGLPQCIESKLLHFLQIGDQYSTKLHWGSPEINNIFYNSKVLLPFVLDNKTFNVEGNKNEEIKSEIYKEEEESKKST